MVPNILRVMSNDEVSVKQEDQLAGQPNEHNSLYIDPYDIHMDQ